MFPEDICALTVDPLIDGDEDVITNRKTEVEWDAILERVSEPWQWYRNLQFPVRNTNNITGKEERN